MSDWLWNLGLYHPDWLAVFRMAVYVGIGVLVGLMIGSIRWWWIKRTRLPQMWHHAREEYEQEIAHWKHECNKLETENGRLATAAFGQVVMQFRSAALRKTPNPALSRARR
jgi:hypothetical protein